MSAPGVEELPSTEPTVTDSNPVGRVTKAPHMGRCVGAWGPGSPSAMAHEMERTRHTGHEPFVALLAAGAAAVWLGIPVLSLWLLSRVSNSYLTIYLCA